MNKRPTSAAVSPSTPVVISADGEATPAKDFSWGYTPVAETLGAHATEVDVWRAVNGPASGGSQAADRAAFEAALARLDDGNYPPGAPGDRMRACDVALVNRHDRRLQAAHGDYLNRCETLRAGAA